ncbi:peptidase [Nonlabens ulvanivorans]|nr:peptidase [Nonlabens ulvanivorans]
MKKFLVIALVLGISLTACKEKEVYVEPEVAEVVVPIMQYGFDLNNYDVVTDTVKSGDTFGNIIDPHLVDGQSVFKAAEELDAVYSVRRIQVGKPYKILKRKDSLGTPEAFIYEPTKMDYVVLNFADSLKAYKDKHPLKFVRKTASGVINLHCLRQWRKKD